MSFATGTDSPFGRHDGPLGGMLVVGLEHSVAGPLCTRILGDLGADVIKVERPPHGDFARSWDANVDGEGAQFWWLNRRKRSVLLDLKDTEGRAAFDRLLARADVFVTNLAAGATKRLSLTRELLSLRYPGLVACHITGYGVDGPFRDRKAYDMLVQAEAGIMSVTGTGEQPTRVGVSIADVGTGIYAAALTLGALLGRLRGRTGEGIHLDIAMHDAMTEYVAPMLVSYLNAGVVYPRLPDHHHAIAPYGVFRCADGGRLLIAVQTDAEWRIFAADALGRPELANDPRFATNVARLAHRADVDRLSQASLGARDTPAATALLDKLRIAYGSVNDVEDVARHPVVADRGILADVATASGASATTVVGMAERLLGGGDARRDRPPRLGEDTDTVLERLGRGGSAASISGRYADGAS
jgi:itaconate CoA-transferase